MNQMSLEEALRWLENCTRCAGCTRCEYHDWAVKVVCEELRKRLD